MTRRRAAPLLLGPLALAAALLAAPAALPQEAPPPPEAPPPAAPAAQLPAISVVTAELRTLRARVIASGLITPVERVFVQPEIEGQATEALLADVGDRVAAGQVLARLSSATLELQKSQLLAARAQARAALAQAEAQLVEARAAADEAGRTRDRVVRLSEQGVASPAQRDQAEAQATAAAARVAVAEQGRAAAEAQIAVIDAQIADLDLKLRRTEVRAPVAGEIAERNAIVGAIASAAGQPMFVIIRDGLLELRADVSESDLLLLAEGQPARLRVVGLAGELEGRVRLVEPTVDAATRLGRVRIALATPEKVRAGLFAEAEVIAAERSGPALPVSAVAGEGEAAHVLVVDAEGRVARRSVVAGIRDGGFVEIREGLAPGERVVARAGAFVRPGDRINPVPVDPDAAAEGAMR